METDIIQTAVTSNNTIVLNGAEVGLCPLSVDAQDKTLSDQLTVTAAPGFLPENAVLVETSRGLLLSVPDGAGGVTYGRITTPVDLQQTASLLVNCTADGLVEAQHAADVFGGQVAGNGLAVGHQPLDGTTELRMAARASLVPTSATPTTCMSNVPLEEEPKKRKGGWPKGKKRKNTSELNAPRAPVTGYVLYAIERRQEIKKTNPDLQFSEVTKVLGNEWSTMPLDKKQKYLTEAEADKKRYIEELNAFQQSVTYQSFLKKRKLKGMCVDPSGLESDAYATLIDLEEDYMSELYCRVCDQYFSSLHNKKEHMFGRQHLQAITGELEKELQQQSEQQQQAQQQQQNLQEAALVTDELHQDSLGSLSDSSDGDTLKLSGPVDIESFIHEFHQKNRERDQEIRQLRRSLKMSQGDNLAMCKQIQELRDLEAKLDQDVGNAKAYGASLTAQIDGLKMVPTLFGVINF